MIITIDGPSASGKSSAAKGLAVRLGFLHINSGLFYRAVAYLLLTKFGYDLARLENPATEDSDAILDPAKLQYEFHEGYEVILFDGVDITNFLRQNGIGQAASIVSRDGYVRTRILTLVRMLADDYNCVVDGRDAGLVIFPEADVKFYLTADVSVRAQRWMCEQQSLGLSFTLEQAEHEITKRDARDARQLSIPLDASIIDNSQLSLEQTVDVMAQEVEKKR